MVFLENINYCSKEEKNPKMLLGNVECGHRLEMAF
jgi:hypothetical protein